MRVRSGLFNSTRFSEALPDIIVIPGISVIHVLLQRTSRSNVHVYQCE